MLWDPEELEPVSSPSTPARPTVQWDTAEVSAVEPPQPKAAKTVQWDPNEVEAVATGQGPAISPVDPSYGRWYPAAPPSAPPVAKPRIEFPEPYPQPKEAQPAPPAPTLDQIERGKADLAMRGQGIKSRSADLAQKWAALDAEMKAFDEEVRQENLRNVGQVLGPDLARVQTLEQRRTELNQRASALQAVQSQLKSDATALLKAGDELDAGIGAFNRVVQAWRQEKGPKIPGVPPPQIPLDPAALEEAMAKPEPLPQWPVAGESRPMPNLAMPPAARERGMERFLARSGGNILNAMSALGMTPATTPEQLAEQTTRAQALAEPLLPISEFAVDPELRGFLRGVEGLSSPADLALLGATAGAGAMATGGLRLLANSPRMLRLVEGSPTLARWVSRAAGGAIPAVFAEEGARNALQEAIKAGEVDIPAEQAEHAGRALASAVFGALGAYGAFRGGKLAGQPHPPASGEVPVPRERLHPVPQEVASAMGIEPTRRITPAEAEQMAVRLEASGDRLAAQSWREMAKGKEPVVWIGPVQAGEYAREPGPVKIQGPTPHPKGKVGGPDLYQVVAPEDGRVLYGGSRSEVDAWVGQHADARTRGIVLGDLVVEVKPGVGSRTATPVEQRIEARPTSPEYAEKLNYLQGELVKAETAAQEARIAGQLDAKLEAEIQFWKREIGNLKGIEGAGLRYTGEGAEAPAARAPVAKPPKTTTKAAPATTPPVPAKGATYTTERGAYTVTATPKGKVTYEFRDATTGAVKTETVPRGLFRRMVAQAPAAPEPAAPSAPEAAPPAPPTQPAAEPQPPPPQPQGVPALPNLPNDLRGAKPRYAFGDRQFDLEFASDVDRAAYITAQTRPSKRDEDYLAFAMQATGMDESDVRALGRRIRDSIKEQARDAEPGTLKVAQVWTAGPKPAAAAGRAVPEPESEARGRGAPAAVPPPGEPTSEARPAAAEAGAPTEPKLLARSAEWQYDNKSGVYRFQRGAVSGDVQEGINLPGEPRIFRATLHGKGGLQETGHGVGKFSTAQEAMRALETAAEAGAPAETTSEKGAAPEQPEAKAIVREPVPPAAPVASEEKPVEARAAGEAEKKEPQTKPKYDYSSTQVNLPDPIASTIRGYAQFIPGEKLAPEAAAGYGGGPAATGRETEPHITVKYGLHTTDAEEVRKLLAGEPPVKVKLGRSSLFSNDEADVLKVDVESEDLQRLNKKIADALPHTDTFPDYKPHATIAYLKPGEGKRYAGKPINGITGKTVTLDRLTFSSKTGEQVEIPLGGEETRGETKAEKWGAAYRANLKKAYAAAPDATPAERETLARRRTEKALGPRPKEAAPAPKAETEEQPAPRGAKPEATPERERQIEDLRALSSDDFATVIQKPGRFDPALVREVAADRKLTTPAPAKPQSYRVYAKVKDEWTPNGQYFATQEEADKAGSSLMSRWMAAEAVESLPEEHEPNYRWDDEQSTAKPIAPPAPAAAAEPEPATPSEPKTGAQSLADAVYAKLKAGESLGNVTELNKLAERHFGSSRTAGEWTPRDAFDAMETGVNRYLIERGKDLLGMDADKGLGELRELMGRITTQGTRTDEQLKNQQFSTPPTESYIAAKVAGITADDVVLEPSAGNGGLAIWPKSIGATVHVNEIAERRLDNLRSLGFENPTAHDGEILNALLNTSVQPTVVLMNPPFSAGTVKSHEAKNRNLYGFNHVESALQRLQPGGRLVAILGGGQANEPEGGASLSGVQSGAWFRKLAGQYNIRANVRISGKEYQKYGTAFATRLIVIDKDGPTRDWNGIVKQNVETLEEAYNVLRDVAESRPEIAARPAAGRGAREGESRVGVGAGTGPARPEPGRVRDRESEPAGAVQPGAGYAGPDRGVGPGEPGAGAEPAVRPEPEPPLARPDERPATEDFGSPAEDLATGREAPGEAGAEAGLGLTRAESRPQAEEEDSDAYVAYHPTLKGVPHPGNIVETKTMATVPMPAIAYRPHLPPETLESGAISAVQLEAIAIAGQANSVVLPGGARGSVLIGDGTGVGKGRIAAGILWDNYRQGRKRLVWVSEKWDLIQDAIRDLSGIGAIDLLRGITEQEGKFVLGADAAVVPFNKYNAKAKLQHDGLLFTTYALIRSESKKGDRRVAQLEEWLRGDDDGEGAYIVFDESHNLKNAVASQGGQESQIGKAVKELLERIPKLRTASLSATAATDVINLGYLDRLGMWGPGTAFPSGFREFGAQVARGKLAAMELIARELKAQGKYVSRTLSFKGVEYSEKEHNLSPEQKELYRTASKAWASVFASAESTIKDTTNGGGRQSGNFHSQFYGAQQRFFNLLITTLKIPTAVELANEALGEGQSVVITLINTSEAAQNREKTKARDPGNDDDEIPDYDFGPKEMLVSLVREHYPVQQWKDDVDSAGNPVKVPVYTKDENGREIPVLNPEAVRQRDELITQIDRDLHLPENPLDILINSLGGEKKVAEITGRKERFDRSTGKFVPRGDPNVPRKDINIVEARNFQAGKKRVAVLSAAGGSGISLHAGNDVKNQQRRYHITIQVGWSADKQMQFFGRTHRTNQASAPQYVMLVSDLGGEKRFVSTIARRLGSLGALTKGQKNANAAGADLMEKVNFETEQGRQAANAFYVSLLGDEPVPGTRGLSGMQVLTDLHVLKSTPDGRMTVPQADRTNVTRLLNRLLALDPDVQNAVYDYYFDIFTAVIKDAIERGTLDTGVRALPGDEFTVREQRAISTDPKTGAETTYFPVEAKVRTHGLSPEELDRRLEAHRTHDPRILIDEHGKLRLAISIDPIVHADGRVEAASYFATPGKGRWLKVSNSELAGHKQHSTEPARRKVEDWATQQLKKAQGGVSSAESTLNYHRRDLEREKEYARERVTGTAETKLHRAETKLQELDQPATSADTVVYGGQRYRLLWEGRTRDGRNRAHLENRSTGRDIWVDQREISRPSAPPADTAAAKREVQAEIESARAELEAAKKQAESVDLPEDHWARSRVAEDERKLAEAQKALAEAEAIAKDPVAWAKERWAEQYEAAPTHITEEHHLIGGAVMRWWNPISESTNIGYAIFTAVDTKTGQRVVGIDIPADRIKALLDRITGGASTVNTSQLVTDVLKNNLTYTLEGGIEVRRNRVGKDHVIQLQPPSQDVARNLVNLGAVHERGAVPIYYVPNRHEGPAEQTLYGILGRILDTYPVKPEEPAQTDQPLMSRAGSMGAKILRTIEDAEQLPAAWEQGYGAGYWVSPAGKAIPLRALGRFRTHPAAATVLAKKQGLRASDAMDELQSAGWIRVRGEGVEATRQAIAGPAFERAVALATDSARARGLGYVYVDEYPWGRHVAVPLRDAAEFAADPQAYLRAAGPMMSPVLEGIPIPPLQVAAKLASKALKSPDRDYGHSDLIADVAAEVDYQVRPAKQGRPTVLWLNGAAAEVIRRGIGGDVEAAEFDGILLEPRHLAGISRALVPMPGKAGDLGQALERLAMEGDPVVAIRANTAAGKAGLRFVFQMYRHEGLHWLQTMLGGGRVANVLPADAVDALLQDQVGALAKQTLEGRGYFTSPAEMVAEIAAHIGARQFQGVGLTAGQALRWYGQYLAAIKTRHGREAVDKIVRLTHGRVRIAGGYGRGQAKNVSVPGRDIPSEGGRGPPSASLAEGRGESSDARGGGAARPASPGARAGVDRPGEGEAVEQLGGEEPLASRAEEARAPDRVVTMPEGTTGHLDLDFFTLGIASAITRPFKPKPTAAFTAAHEKWVAAKRKADAWQTSYEAKLATATEENETDGAGATAEELKKIAQRRTIKAIGPRPKLGKEPTEEQFTGPVTEGQIKQIRAAQRKQDVPEARLREVLQRSTGKTSMENLTGAQAIRVLEELTALGVEQLGRIPFYTAINKNLHSPSWWLGRSEAGQKIYESAEKHWFEQDETAKKLAKWWHEANKTLAKAQVMKIGLYRDTKQLLDHYQGDKDKVKALIEKGGEDPALVDDMDRFLSDKERAVSERWDEIFEWTRKKGVAAGFLPADLKIETYLPFYYEEFFQRHPERMDAAAVDLAQELGIATTFAMQLLKQANVKNVKFGSFDIERTRWALPGMRDPNKRYEIFSKGFARKMAITAFLDEINKKPGWFAKIQNPKIKELAHDYIDQYAGRPGYSGAGRDAKWAGRATGLQYAAKIGINLFTPTLNLTQTVLNTGSKYGYLRTAKVAARLPGTWGGVIGGTLGGLLLGPPGTALGIPIGVALASELYRLPRSINPFIRQMLELQRAGILDTFHAKFERPHLHGIAEAAQESLGYLFDKSESLNRSIAYLAGVDAAKAAGATRGQMVQAGRNAVRITQFFTGRLDAPLFARTPLGKVVMQFKTFQLKEIEFIQQLTPKQKLKFVIAVLALAGPAAWLIYQAMKRFMPDDETTALMEEWQETYNVAAFLHAGKLTEQLGIYTIPGMEALGTYGYGDRLLKWAAGPSIGAFIDTAAQTARFVLAEKRFTAGPRGGRSPAEQWVLTLIRSWSPGGAELLRVRRAMKEAKNADEALRILVNFADQDKKKKKKHRPR